MTRSTGLFREDESRHRPRGVRCRGGRARPTTRRSAPRWTAAWPAGSAGDRRPAPLGTWDLYWMAVDPALHGHGIGQPCSARWSSRLAGRARLIVVETAGRDDYGPTRAFYEARGYHASRAIPDFYAPGDDQVVYVKYSRALRFGLKEDGYRHGDLAGGPAKELDRVPRSARQSSSAPRISPSSTGCGMAAENFEFRISPAMVDLIKAPNDPIWRQYVPTVEELEVRRRHRRLAQRGRGQPGAEHHAPLSRPGAVPGLARSAPATAASAPGGARWATPRRSRCRSSSRRSSTSRSTPRSATSSCRAAIRCCSTTGGWTRSWPGSGRSRTSRSSGSGAGSRATCRSGSRRSSAR